MLVLSPFPVKKLHFDQCKAPALLPPRKKTKARIPNGKDKINPSNPLPAGQSWGWWVRVAELQKPLTWLVPVVAGLVDMKHHSFCHVVSCHLFYLLFHLRFCSFHHTSLQKKQIIQPFQKHRGHMKKIGPSPSHNYQIVLFQGLRLKSICWYLWLARMFFFLWGGGGVVWSPTGGYWDCWTFKTSMFFFDSDFYIYVILDYIWLLHV